MRTTDDGPAADGAAPGHGAEAGAGARTVALEIAVTDVAGARAAAAGGADRLELCCALELGGLTPSPGLVDAVVAVGLPVHVLVRARPGDFVHDADETALVEADLRAALRAGAAGVVVGALTGTGEVDLRALHRWVDAAREERGAHAEVTFHRAVDHAADPVRAAADLAGSGVRRVLTSGGAARAGDAVEALTRMCDRLGRVEVTAGGGVREHDVPALVAAGVHGVHLSARRRAGTARRGVPLGSGTTEEDAGQRWATDPALVARVRARLDALRAG